MAYFLSLVVIQGRELSTLPEIRFSSVRVFYLWLT